MITFGGSRVVKAAVFAGVAVASGLLAGQAHAQTNLVTNGNFSNFVSGVTPTSTEVGGTGSYGNIAANVQGWNSAGYSFIFLPNAGAVSGTSADTTGASDPAVSNTTLYLWGPGSGSSVTEGTPNTGNSSGVVAASGGNDGGSAGVANGLTNSPAGSNFIGIDSANYLSGALSQTISGLQGGGVYKLTFYWAAAEQEGASYEAATTEKFNVSLGNSTQSTATISNLAQGFSGWQMATMYFEAGAGSSQVLSFLAAGTPSGVPPFALLDGVSLVLAPEPTSWAIMAAGLLGAGLLVWKRRRPAKIDAISA